MPTDYTVLRCIPGVLTRDLSGSRIRLARLDASETQLPEIALERASLSSKEVGELARDPQIARAAPSIPMRLLAPVAEKVPAAGSVSWGIGAVRADDNSKRTGAGTIVAVLDTGIDAGHEAFKGVALVEKDFSGSGNGDRQGHGTHCAGTIFGRDVAGTRIGVARGVTQALIGKVFADQRNSESAWLFEAMQWAINNRADVISMSLGFDFPGLVERQTARGWPVALATSQALVEYTANLRMFDAIMAVARARRPFDGGVVVVAAAGNESQRHAAPAIELAPSLPASAEDVISVGALGLEGNRFTVADFSNTPPQVSAPGVEIVSAKAGGGLRTLSGTSMATPHVAGIAALWWEELRSGTIQASAQTVVAKLLATARIDKFDPAADPADRGVGLVTAP